MADRIKKADMVNAFAAFTARAAREGFNTAGWKLIAPDALGAYWRLFHVAALPGEATHRYEETPFPAQVGFTNREAYDRLVAWSQCLDSIKRNREMHSE